MQVIEYDRKYFSNHNRENWHRNQLLFDVPKIILTWSTQWQISILQSQTSSWTTWHTYDFKHIEIYSISFFKNSILICVSLASMFVQVVVEVWWREKEKATWREVSVNWITEKGMSSDLRPANVTLNLDISEMNDRSDNYAVRYCVCTQSLLEKGSKNLDHLNPKRPWLFPDSYFRILDYWYMVVGMFLFL